MIHFRIGVFKLTKILIKRKLRLDFFKEACRIWPQASCAKCIIGKLCILQTSWVTLGTCCIYRPLVVKYHYSFTNSTSLFKTGAEKWSLPKFSLDFGTIPNWKRNEYKHAFRLTVLLVKRVRLTGISWGWTLNDLSKVLMRVCENSLWKIFLITLFFYENPTAFIDDFLEVMCL